MKLVHAPLSMAIEYLLDFHPKMSCKLPMAPVLLYPL